MKTKQVMFKNRLVAIGLFTISMLLSGSALSDHELAFKLYPGAVKVGDAYYTNDPIIKVEKWYLKNTKRAYSDETEIEEGTGDKEVSIALSLGDGPGEAYSSHVRIKQIGGSLTNCKAKVDYAVRSNIFYSLKRKLSNAKFQAMCKQYGYLELRHNVAKDSNKATNKHAKKMTENEYINSNPEYAAIQKRANQLASSGDQMGYMRELKKLSPLKKKLQKEYKEKYANDSDSTTKSKGSRPTKDEYVNSNPKYVELSKKYEESKANGASFDTLGYRTDMRKLKEQLKKEYDEKYAGNIKAEKAVKKEAEKAQAIEDAIKELETMHQLAQSGQGYWKTRIHIGTLRH